MVVCEVDVSYDSEEMLLEPQFTLESYLRDILILIRLEQRRLERLLRGGTTLIDLVVKSLDVFWR